MRGAQKIYIYTIEQQRLTMMMMMRTFAHFMKFNGARLQNQRGNYILKVFYSFSFFFF